MPQKPATSRSSTPQAKGEKIATLLKRKTGASIDELTWATGWQKHSIRGFISGTLKKKQNLLITSSKEENKKRRYFVTEKSQ